LERQVVEKVGERGRRWGVTAREGHTNASSLPSEAG
jgi:hypothetical protein